MYYNFLETETTTPDGSESLFELVADEDRKKFVCKHSGCGKIFRYKSEIIRHIATHSESRPFICQYDNCFKSFKRNDALENHIRSSHTKETPFTCPLPECGMKFTTHGSYRYHVLKHNKQSSEGESFDFPTEQVPDISQTRKQVKLNPQSDTKFGFNEEPFKVSQKFASFDENHEFFVPPPRLAGKIQWEMVSDDLETSNTPAPKNESSQQDKLQVILEENKLLKQKLTTSEKMIKNMQKQIDDLLYSLFERKTSQRSEVLSNVMSNDVPMMESGLFQSNFQETNGNSEEQFFDMITYEDNSSSNVQAGPTYNNETNFSTDMFLSFDREMGSLDFNLA